MSFTEGNNPTGMSALGQKQTFAVQNVMSALPRKRTFSRGPISYTEKLFDRRGRHRIMSPGMSVERRIRPVPCSAYRA